jgi:hypothetical protein
LGVGKANVASDGQRIHAELSAQQAATLQPYIQALWVMFSPQVLLALKH